MFCCVFQLPGLRKLQTAVDQAEKADLNKQTQKVITSVH